MPTIDRPSKALSSPTKRPGAEDLVDNDLPERESRQAMRLGRCLKPNMPTKVTQVGPVTFDRMLPRRQRGGCRPHKKNKPDVALSTDHRRFSPTSLGPPSPKRRKIDGTEFCLIPLESQNDSITGLLTLRQPVAEQSMPRTPHHQTNDRTPSQFLGTLGVLKHHTVSSDLMIPKPSPLRWSGTQRQPGKSSLHAVGDSSRPSLDMIQYDARNGSQLQIKSREMLPYCSSHSYSSTDTNMSKISNKRPRLPNRNLIWSSSAIIATIRHRNMNSGYKVQLRRFIPRLEERCQMWWDGSRLQGHIVPPFAIANMHEARVEVSKYIDRIVCERFDVFLDIEGTRFGTRSLEGSSDSVRHSGTYSATLNNSFDREVSITKALRDHLSPWEMKTYLDMFQVVSDILRLWTAEELLNQPIRIQGDERLGAKVQDASGHHCGMMLPTPVLETQLENVIVANIIVPVRRHILCIPATLLLENDGDYHLDCEFAISRSQHDEGSTIVEQPFNIIFASWPEEGQHRPKNAIIFVHRVENEDAYTALRSFCVDAEIPIFHEENLLYTMFGGGVRSNQSIFDRLDYF
ncbi:hypothetical protein BKA63DRAFT_552273 [Paraphoma chrysanthemicola]|nr:hypothetical protein BKA63DRAFT_552273 [Paraphoma chrysanthemicola]